MKHILHAGVWKKIAVFLLCGMFLTGCSLSLESIKIHLDQLLRTRTAAVEVTRMVEVTRIVEITVVVTPTYTATATVTPTPVKPQEPVPNHPFIVTKLPP